MPYRVDLSNYTTIPTRTPRTCMSLSRALVVAADKKPSKAVVERLAKIHKLAAALQADWIEANRPSASSETVRAVDLRLDRVISAWRARLQNWVDIEDEDNAKRAGELIELLFPTGLDFINLPYPEQWAECERRIALIESDGLEDEIADLIDERFVKHLYSAHAEYGEVLGITGKKQPEPAPVRVGESMRKLRVAMSNYARLVLGLADEDDDQAVARAEAALEPILRFRKARSSGAKEADEVEVEAGSDEAELEPIEAPLPELPTIDE